MNSNLLFYALASLRRRWRRQIAILLIFTVLVFMLVAVFTITGSLKYESQAINASLPQLLVQQQSGGRQTDIPVAYSFEIATLSGVSSARARVWGFYYAPEAKSNLTLVGIDTDLPVLRDSYAEIIDFHRQSIDSAGGDFFIIGSGVRQLLKQNFYGDYYRLRNYDGGFFEAPIVGTIRPAAARFSSDIVLLPEHRLREVFGLPGHLATDIAVYIPNPNEVEVVKRKIARLYPNSRIVSSSDIARANAALFDYTGGLFMLLMLAAVFAFFILVYDRASGLPADDRREIGILKTLGWSTENIIHQQLLSAGLIAVSGFFLGTALALAYVFFADAPGLNEILLGSRSLRGGQALTPFVDYPLLFSVFIVTIPTYMLAVAIPAWRTAIRDADEVMR
jgi:putative ABC transport system permease protein